WPRTLSHTTRYFPEISFGDAPLVVKLKVPISRAAAGPNRLTSRVVIFGLPACSAMPFHIAPIAAFPRTIAEPGGNAIASPVYSSAIPAKSPLLNTSIHFAIATLPARRVRFICLHSKYQRRVSIGPGLSPTRQD